MNGDTQEDRWLSVLAGKQEGDASAYDREAAAVRHAALAMSEREMNRQELDSGLERLMFRLRRERLHGPEPRRAYWTAWALAATVIFGISLTVMLPERMEPVPEESVSRGLSWPQELTDADPAALALRLSGDLKALGIQATRTQEGESVLLEARIRQRDDPALASVLDRYRLRAPSDGTLRVRIHPAGR